LTTLVSELEPVNVFPVPSKQRTSLLTSDRNGEFCWTCGTSVMPDISCRRAGIMASGEDGSTGWGVAWSMPRRGEAGKTSTYIRSEPVQLHSPYRFQSYRVVAFLISEVLLRVTRWLQPCQAVSATLSERHSILVLGEKAWIVASPHVSMRAGTPDFAANRRR
jgi:hypothetical protein